MFDLVTIFAIQIVNFFESSKNNVLLALFRKCIGMPLHGDVS